MAKRTFRKKRSGSKKRYTRKNKRAGSSRRRRRMHGGVTIHGPDVVRNILNSTTCDKFILNDRKQLIDVTRKEIENSMPGWAAKHEGETLQSSGDC
jgi:hypothetical protein